MSTSSGRKGNCTRCGHFFNEHANSRDSKCKKCKKTFEICQVTTHRGWRICFIPCRCGEQYYPDKARAAVPLASHEYLPDHPGYRPLSPDEDEYETTDRTTSKYAEHARTDSAGSEDPLAWSAQRFERETIKGIDQLVNTMANTHIEESSTTSWSEWAWDNGRNQWGRYRTSGNEYEYEWRDPESTDSSTSNQGGSSTTSWSEWAWDNGRNQWGRYRMSGNEYEYEWRDPEPLGSSTSNPGSSSGKGKGRAAK